MLEHQHCRGVLLVLPSDEAVVHVDLLHCRLLLVGRATEVRGVITPPLDAEPAPAAVRQVGGLVGLPLHPRRLERAAGATGNPGLLALLGTRLGLPIRCRRRWHIPVGDAVTATAAVVAAGIPGRRWRHVLAGSLAAGLTAAAAPDGQRSQYRSARARRELATSGRAALRAAPPVSLTVSASFATPLLRMVVC